MKPNDCYSGDDCVPVKWEDLSDKDQAGVLAALEAYEDRRRRAKAIDDILRTRLSQEHLQVLAVEGLTSQLDEKRLGAFEALVALIPGHGGTAQETCASMRTA